MPGAVSPLNLLVMGRDHKLYYEAYNDHSDLNGGGLDVGYKPDAFGVFSDTNPKHGIGLHLDKAVTPKLNPSLRCIFPV